MLTDSLLSIIGVNNHWKDVTLIFENILIVFFSLTWTESGNSIDFQTL